MDRACHVSVSRAALMLQLCCSDHPTVQCWWTSAYSIPMDLLFSICRGEGHVFPFVLCLTDVNFLGLEHLPICSSSTNPTGNLVREVFQGPPQCLLLETGPECLFLYAGFALTSATLKPSSLVFPFSCRKALTESGANSKA